MHAVVVAVVVMPWMFVDLGVGTPFERFWTSFYSSRIQFGPRHQMIWDHRGIDWIVVGDGTWCFEVVVVVVAAALVVVVPTLGLAHQVVDVVVGLVGFGYWIGEWICHVVGSGATGKS